MTTPAAPAPERAETPLRSPALDPLPGIRHGFFTRTGGVSTGLYAGLNCGPGSGDAPDSVVENRRRAMAMLGQDDKMLATMHQIHSATCLEIAAPPLAAPRPRADGLVTRTPGLTLGILTADCVPVLLADAQTPVIGACHAGWKGALGGILEATIACLLNAGARRESLVAAIGPSIRQPSYEVGPGFPAPFLAADPANEGFFRPAARPGHWLFDLPGYVAQRLRAAGIGRISDLARDTYVEEDAFFSYRRATHRAEPDYGRQLSAIVLMPPGRERP